MPGPGMRFFGRALAAMLAAVLAAASVAPAATGHSQSKSYTWGLGDLMVLCGTPSRGGACFAPASGETRVAVAATDDLLNPVGLVLEFRDADGVTVGSLVPGCGQIAARSIPATVKQVVVSIDGPIFGPQDCLGQGLGIGTTGTIKATFT